MTATTRIAVCNAKRRRTSRERMASLQIADIGRYGFDLRLGQAPRNQRHDVRCVLPPLLAPIRQLERQIGIKLTCQTWKLPIAFGLFSVTGRAGENIGAGNTLFIDLLSGSHELLRRIAEGLWIEVVKIGCKRLYHCRAHDMPDVEHDVIGTLMLDKALQLIFDI